MMFNIIFLILLLGVLAAWKGYRQITMTTFAIALLLATYVFITHISSSLAIQL